MKHETFVDPPYDATPDQSDSCPDLPPCPTFDFDEAQEVWRSNKQGYSVSIKDDWEYPRQVGDRVYVRTENVNNCSCWLRGVIMEVKQTGHLVIQYEDDQIR